MAGSRHRAIHEPRLASRALAKRAGGSASWFGHGIAIAAPTGKDPSNVGGRFGKRWSAECFKLRSGSLEFLQQREVHVGRQASCCETLETPFAVPDFRVDPSDGVARLGGFSRKSSCHGDSHEADPVAIDLTDDPKRTFSLNAWQRPVCLL